MIVSSKVLPNIDTPKCKVTKVSDYLCNVNTFPVVRCYLKCDFYEGFVDAIIAPIKFCSVLVGNIPGLKNVSTKCVADVASESVLAIKTRSASCNVAHPLVVPALGTLDLTHDQFLNLQNSCDDLSDVRRKLNSKEITHGRNGTSFQFQRHNCLIYRVCLNSNAKSNTGKRTLVVPLECRKFILKLAHEALLAGHFSHRKTEWRISETFYWP